MAAVAAAAALTQPVKADLASRLAYVVMFSASADLPRDREYCRRTEPCLLTMSCLSMATPRHQPELQRSAQAPTARREALTEARLLDALDAVRRTVVIAFPDGLPEWDLVRQILEGRENLQESDVRPCC